MHQLPQAFLEAVQIQAYTQSQAVNRLSFYDELTIPAAEMTVYPFVHDEALQFAIKSGDPSRLEQSLTRLAGFLQENCARSELAIRRVCLTLYNNIHQIMLGLENCSEKDHILAAAVFSQLNSARGIPAHIQVIRHFAGHALELYREHGLTVQSRLHGQTSGELAEKVMAYIQQHFSEPLNISQIADALHVSVPNLYRAMRENYGITPANLLNEVRITQSAELLRQTSLTIAEITLQCGFETKQSFYRQFNKRFSCSPSLYRARHAKGRSGGQENDA